MVRSGEGSSLEKSVSIGLASSEGLVSNAMFTIALAAESLVASLSELSRSTIASRASPR